MFAGLPFVCDRELLASTDRIVREDRTLTLRLLDHLHAVEQRKLYLQLGYSSMFDYCVRHQRLSETDALRKIRTARCVARFRELIPLLESGATNPTAVSMIAAHIEETNAGALIEAIQDKSTREVERFIAALQPLSLVPADRVRPIVVPAQNWVKSTSSAGGKESSNVGVEASNECVGTSVMRFARVEFTAHEELMTMLDRIRSLASHRLPVNATLADVINYMAKYVLWREDPVERSRRRRARRKPPAVATPENAGRIPASVRDQVFASD